MRPHYRQGDILLLSVPDIDKDARPLPRDRGRIVLALGEATGHAHAIADPEATLLETGSPFRQRFLRVLAKGGVRLSHEEHDSILLPQGAYEVRRQREYEPGSAWSMVAD